VIRSYIVREDNQSKRARTVKFQEAPQSTDGMKNFGSDVNGAVGPTENDDVVVYRNRRKPLFQISDLAVEPSRDNGHERTQKYHIAQNSNNGGDESPPRALIVAEITRV